MKDLFQMALGNRLFKRLTCKNDCISEYVHTFYESSRNLLPRPSLAQSVERLKVDATPLPLSTNLKARCLVATLYVHTSISFIRQINAAYG